jgi:nucleoside-diphosphate-sugar epimerase
VKILITGATGFIGQHVTPLLMENEEVAILLRGGNSLRKTPLVIEGNLNHLAECQSQIKDFNPDVCLHLAWEGIPDYSYKTSKKNLDQSIALVDYLIEQTNCRKIVVSGSCFEYGKAMGQISESAKEENSSPIAWAKNSLKNYIALRATEKNFNWIWFRIFYAFGPGQRPQALIPSLFSAAQSNAPSPIRNPLNANDFIYIEDVAKAFVTATVQNTESGIYNLGSGTLFKVTDIWNIVKKRLNSMDRKQSGNGLSNLQNSDTTAVGSYANIEKARTNLGWTPQITVSNGIDRFINYLLEQRTL